MNMIKYVLLWASIGGFLVSCGGETEVDRNIAYRIPSTHYGDYDASLDGHHIQTDYKVQEEHIDRIIRGIEDSKKKKVLVFIHGGLGTKKGWTEKIEKLRGEADIDGYYPVFVTWRSGIFTSILGRYSGVRNGVDRSLADAIGTAPAYFISDVTRGIAALPESYQEQTQNIFESEDKIFSRNHEEIVKFQKRFGSSFYYTGYGNSEGPLGGLWYRTKQVIPGAARVVTSPIIDGLGEKAWNIMFRRARLLTYRQTDLAFRGISEGGEYAGQTADYSLAEVGSKYYEKSGANGVAAQLMRGLSNIDGIKITLAGHSMGAIVANDLVAEFPEIKYDKILHFASADSNRHLVEKTFRYLGKKENKQTQFWNLCLHPTNEEREQSVQGAVPQGSLLIWLDYYLMNPETTMDRRAGRWDNVKWILPHFEKLPNAQIKVFGRRDSRGDEVKKKLEWPIKHGDFSERYFWKEEFYGRK